MKDYSIKVNFITGEIMPDKDIELVKDDYNTSTFNFVFEQNILTGQRVVIAFLKPDGTPRVANVTLDTETTGHYDIGAILDQAGPYYFQLILFTATGRLTATGKVKLNTQGELVDDVETITADDDRLPILTSLISEVTGSLLDLRTLQALLETKLANGDFNGAEGQAGTSPTIEVIYDADNIYKLKITDKNRSIETPDLRGKSFTYEDFTPEQILALKGEPFRYADFTPEQIAAITGSKIHMVSGTPASDLGVDGDWAIDTSVNSYIFYKSNNTWELKNSIRGAQGPAFTYDDFTEAQLEALKGSDGKGIISISKTGTTGVTDTYTITYSDNTTSTFNVVNGTNGKGIASIAKTGTVGFVDTYTITYSDTTTSIFTVVNGTNGITPVKGVDYFDGEDGVSILSIEKTGTVGNVDTYTITFSDETTSTFTVTNGLGSGDMLKADYDTDRNGIVDNAEKVNGHTVEIDVPANALFTDTIYTHPVSHPPSIILQDANNRFVTDVEKTAWNAKAAGTHTHTASQVTDFDTEVSNNTDVAANTTARHAHSNKATLDTYNQTNTNLADAVTKKHSHTNATVLNNTTASFLIADETKLDGIETGAQVNDIEIIKVNGVALPITSKTVDIITASDSPVFNITNITELIAALEDTALVKPIVVPNSLEITTDINITAKGTNIFLTDVNLVVNGNHTINILGTENNPLILFNEYFNISGAANGTEDTLTINQLTSDVQFMVRILTLYGVNFTVTSTNFGYLLYEKIENISSTITGNVSQMNVFTSTAPATADQDGLMSAADKIKLDSITAIFTTAKDTKLTGIANGAQVNSIEGIQLNGVDLTPDANKKVNITTPTRTLYTTTIPTTGWTGTSAPYYIDIAVAGIPDSTPVVDVVQSATVATALLQLAAWNKIDKITVSAGSIRVHAYTALPTTAIPIQLEVVI